MKGKRENSVAFLVGDDAVIFKEFVRFFGDTAEELHDIIKGVEMNCKYLPPK